MPKKGTSKFKDKNEWIGYCAYEDKAMKKEFPDEDQRLAVCYSYWKSDWEPKTEQRIRKIQEVSSIKNAVIDFMSTTRKSSITYSDIENWFEEYPGYMSVFDDDVNFQYFIDFLRDENYRITVTNREKSMSLKAKELALYLSEQYISQIIREELNLLLEKDLAASFLELYSDLEKRTIPDKSVVFDCLYTLEEFYIGFMKVAFHFRDEPTNISITKKLKKEWKKRLSEITKAMKSNNINLQIETIDTALNQMHYDYPVVDQMECYFSSREFRNVLKLMNRLGRYEGPRASWENY